MRRLYAFDLDGTLIEEFIRTEECGGCHGTGIEPHWGGTCEPCRGKGRTFGEVLPYENVTVLPRRRERLAELRDAGAGIAICTNQGGISLGYQTFRDVEEKLLRAVRALGLSAPAYAPSRSPQTPQFASLAGRANYWVGFAPYHPDAARPIGRPEDRKPEPGLLNKALAWFGCKPEEALFVGDLATDRDTARAAGVDFLWAEEFFDDAL